MGRTKTGIQVFGVIFYKRARTLYESNGHYTPARRAMTDPGATLGDVIHRRTAALTRADRRVARTLFAGNPMAGFDTVAGRRPEDRTP